MIDYGVAMLVLAGEIRSGDRHLVEEHSRGVTIAVVDGLGHGAEAGSAADDAIATLAAHAQEDIGSLLRRCHERLRNTRGAVVTIACVEAVPGTMSWGGVGNVEAMLIHAAPRAGPARRDFPVLRGGIVGHRLPPLRPSVISVGPGDILILATDGVSRSFLEDVPRGNSPQQMADSILARHAIGSDDALVLVAMLLQGDEGQSGQSRR